MTVAPTVALAHEWLVSRYGSEKTFQAMAAALPGADLYALSYNRESRLDLGGRRVHTTVLDRAPVALRRRRDLQLPLMPAAWRLAGRGRRYDVVVTSSHACAKGFRPARQALHLCYCYTPLRYVWLPTVDRRGRGTPATWAAGRALRHWDLTSVGWVDEFAAISTAVRERVARIYGRPSRVVHPPVATDFFTPDPDGEPGHFALVVSRLVPYKRVDVAIRACHEVGIPLVVAGSGPEEEGLWALAEDLGAQVLFVTAPDDEALRGLYRGASVLVFPADEDFGIVSVEAQACGTPVVALASGGSLDTVRDGVTGVLVDSQDPAGFAAGIRRAVDHRFDPWACRAHAETFSASRFTAEFRDWVSDAAAARGVPLVLPALSPPVAPAAAGQGPAVAAGAGPPRAASGGR